MTGAGDCGLSGDVKDSRGFDGMRSIIVGTWLPIDNRFAKWVSRIASTSGFNRTSHAAWLPRLSPQDFLGEVGGEDEDGTIPSPLAATGDCKTGMPWYLAGGAKDVFGGFVEGMEPRAGHTALPPGLPGLFAPRGGLRLGCRAPTRPGLLALEFPGLLGCRPAFGLPGLSKHSAAETGGLTLRGMNLKVWPGPGEAACPEREWLPVGLEVALEGDDLPVEVALGRRLLPGPSSGFLVWKPAVDAEPPRPNDVRGEAASRIAF